MRDFIIGASTFLVLGLIACSAPYSGDLADRSAGREDPIEKPASSNGPMGEKKGIIGGTPSAGDPAVVAVISIGDGRENGCTGEIVAPKVVLTASHCLSEATLGFQLRQVQVITAPDIATASATDTIFATNAFIHPEFVPATLANDVAILVLERETSIKPLPIHRAPLEALAGKSGRVVGYGTTKDGDASTYGKKNQTTFEVAQVQPTTFLARTSLPATQCHGDSGGPALLTIDGVETIVGIGWRTVADDAKCNLGVKDTRVDAYAAWIDTFIQANGIPAADNGNGPNGGGGVACCINGARFACPTAADCLGGFDVSACIDGCAGNTSCILQCSQQASQVNGPTAACRPAGSC